MTPWLDWEGDRAYNRERDQVVVRLQGHDASALAFNADHSLLVSCGTDSKFCLWDMATYRKLVTWQGHGAELTALAWHPDGRTLVAASKDGAITVWNLEYLRRELKALKLGW